jgi:hypothetical protein
MKLKKSIAQEAEQEQSLKFTRLIVRSILFLAVFISISFVIKRHSIPQTRLFLSEIPIVYTWLISLTVVIFSWAVYLVIVVKDSTWHKIKRVLFIGGYNTPIDVGIKWFVLILLLIIAAKISPPSLYSNINALYHGVIFEGKAILSEDGRGRDNRFVWVSVESRGEQYRFEGKTKQFGSLRNKEVHITVYQGLFSKYALVEPAVMFNSGNFLQEKRQEADHR